MNPQSLEALSLANHTRLERCRIKREIKQADSARISRLRCAKFLEDRPAVIGGMRVAELLLACRRMGGVKVDQILRVAGVSSFRLVSDLTDRQRGVLVRELRSHRNGSIEGGR